jgi:hypothetical protein
MLPRAPNRKREITVFLFYLIKKETIVLYCIMLNGCAIVNNKLEGIGKEATVNCFKITAYTYKAEMNENE